ncbi:hypothetical protein FACS189452_00480 [Bacteroidia bacterium]|nr:hypothetical protein FACS189452_00480 [Bacteroidia bacterium]
MKFNTLLSKFAPHERKFYPILNSIADNNLEAVGHLIELTKAADKSAYKDLYHRIKALETKGDKILAVLFEELNNTFITPFDREDINALGEELDDVMDSINSTAKRVEMYQPDNLPARALEMALLLQESCRLVQQAIGQLEMMQKQKRYIKDTCKQLHSLENQADDVYEHFIIDLFDKEKDAIQLIKLKEIMQEIERATDRADCVGKIIRSIIVKYA